MDGTPPDRDPAPVTGLFHSLNNFVATLVAIAHTRLQLLTTELQEEVQEVGQLLIWSFVAIFAVMMALFLGALAIIFVFWDDRILAASLIMLAFLLIAAGAGLMLWHKLASKPPMLDATLAELAKDRDQLRARL